MQSIDLYGLTVDFDKNTPYAAYMKLKTELEQCLISLIKALEQNPTKTICHYVLLEIPLYFTVIANGTDIHIGLYNNQTKEIYQNSSYNGIKALTTEKIEQLNLRLLNMIKHERHLSPGTGIYQAWQRCLEQEQNKEEIDNDYER